MKKLNFEKAIPIIELIVAVLYIATTVFIAFIAEENQTYIFPYFFIGYFAISILLIIVKRSKIRQRLPLFIADIAINALALIFTAIYVKKFYSVCLIYMIYVATNFLYNNASFFVKKNNKDINRTTMFGMGNVLNIITFVILFILYNDKSAEHYYAMGSVFGFNIQFLGLLWILKNDYIRPHIYSSEFGKAIKKVHGYEILLGLVTIIFMAAILFPIFEPNIPTFADSVWYCFILISTVGFGDLVAVTSIGRFLSIIIGIYGIVIIAILTSTIVCYLQSKGEDDEEEKDASK